MIAGPTELEGGRGRVQAQPAERCQVGAALSHEQHPGLRDRSSRPHRSPRSHFRQNSLTACERLRRERWTGVRIAQATGLSRATVSRILTRLKLNKIRMLEPAVPIVRYEHARSRRPAAHRHQEAGPHRTSPAIASPAIPRMKPAAPAGSFFMSPSTTTPASPSPLMLPDEKATSSSRFLRQAVAYFAAPRHPRPPRHDRQRSLLLFHPLRPSLPPNSNSPIPALASTPHAPMARPNASSKPLSASGPTPVSTRTPPNACVIWLLGFISTTGIDRILPSTKNHPSADPASMSTTS